jgi:uncharacterized membrane protein
MRNPTPWFMLLFAGESVVTMAMAVPLLRGWVKPNPMYGLRTPRTLSDEGLWYRSNRYGGRLMFRTGLVQLIVVVALFGVPSLRDNFVAYNLLCGAMILGNILLSCVLMIRHTRSPETATVAHDPRRAGQS